MAHAVGTTAIAGSGGPTETVARCHAGIVVSVDPTTRRFVLEEMSPGRQARRIVVQVDGRVRSRLTADVAAQESEIREMALADGRVRPWLSGRQVARVVVVPGRLVNIVTRP